MTTAYFSRMQSIGTQRHYAYCKAGNWPGSWLTNSAQSIQTRLGGKSAVCKILWRTVMAPLIRRSLGRSLRRVFQSWKRITVMLSALNATNHKVQPRQMPSWCRNTNEIPIELQWFLHWNPSNYTAFIPLIPRSLNWREWKKAIAGGKTVERFCCILVWWKNWVAFIIWTRTRQN